MTYLQTNILPNKGKIAITSPAQFLTIHQALSELGYKKPTDWPLDDIANRAEVIYWEDARKTITWSMIDLLDHEDTKEPLVIFDEHFKPNYHGDLQENTTR